MRGFGRRKISGSWFLEEKEEARDPQPAIMIQVRNLRHTHKLESADEAARVLPAVCGARRRDHPESFEVNMSGTGAMS